MAETSEREVLGWELFGRAARELAQLVADSGYEPNIILAVARGGLLPAAAIAYSLGVKNVFTMNVEFYTGVDQRLDFPGDVAAAARCGGPRWSPRALRSAVRETPFRGQVRLCLAPDRPVGQLSMVRPPTRRARQTAPGRRGVLSQPELTCERWDSLLHRDRGRSGVARVAVLSDDLVAQPPVERQVGGQRQAHADGHVGKPAPRGFHLGPRHQRAADPSSLQLGLDRHPPHVEAARGGLESEATHRG